MKSRKRLYTTRIDRLQHERGAALFAAVLALVVLSTLILAMTVIGRNEMGIAQVGRNETQAAYAAEAGANYGRWMLAQRLRNDLPRVVSATGRSAMVTKLQDTSASGYNSYNGGAKFLLDFATPATSGPTFSVCTSYTRTDGKTGCPEPTFSAVGAIPDAQQVILPLTGTDPTYTTYVIVGVHPTIPPVIANGGTTAKFTYVWRIESTGTAGQARQQYVIHDSAVPDNTVGSFTIALNADFVQYAHFINDGDAAGGPWISFRHHYSGPVHTNTRFKILGNAPTAGQEGPTFEDQATQTLTDTRFNTGGVQTRDSSSGDWPILGLAPSIICKVIDCSGFTRGYDYNPTTVAIDPIPFPGAGNTDRILEANKSLQDSYGSLGTQQAPSAGCAGVFVIVANNCTTQPPGTSVGALNGGIYVNGRAYDLQLAAMNGTNCYSAVAIATAANCNGQQITVYSDALHYVAITENRTGGTTRVQRYCRKLTAGAATCNGILSPPSSFFLDPTLAVNLNDQTFTGTISPSATVDHGQIWVTSTCIAATGCGTTGAIGQPSTLTLLGLRRNPAATAAIDANTRLNIAADGDIFIAGELSYAVDPRGADGIFSSPIPGDASGTSADDNLSVQNVLGVVSWNGGTHLSAALPVSDLKLHGMFMVPNINGGATTGEGQFSNDDPNGIYRGFANLLGGVVQQTMGILGTPGSPGTGFARNWVYDERFKFAGLAPPNFPGFPNFTAATSVGIDSFSWRQGLF
jgi:hypothetical protein